MALQNALGNLALDQSIQQLVAAVATLNATAQAQQAALEHQGRMFPPRTLQYARDASDRMYVNVGVMPTTVVAQAWGNSSGAWPGWYGQGAPNSMDARETQRELSQQTFNGVRKQRWVIT